MMTAVSLEREAVKTCRRCGVVKSLSAMKRDPRYADGCSSYCKQCHGAATVAWQKANPERLRQYQRQLRAKNIQKIRAQRRARYNTVEVRVAIRKRRYSATPEWYAATLERQGHACAICKRHQSEFIRPLAIDHDHRCCKKPPTCGACTRGLLCPPCNTALSSIEQNSGWLAAALAYMERRGIHAS